MDDKHIRLVVLQMLSQILGNPDILDRFLEENPTQPKIVPEDEISKRLWKNIMKLSQGTNIEKITDEQVIAYSQNTATETEKSLFTEIYRLEKLKQNLEDEDAMLGGILYAQEKKELENAGQKIKREMAGL